MNGLMEKAANHCNFTDGVEVQFLGADFKEAKNF